MGFELFIALRYLFSKRQQAFISVISIMSVLGVAIGVGALVVVMGVYNGFTEDIRNKILGANSHIFIQSVVPQYLDVNEDGLGGYVDVVEKITQNPEVKAAAPFLYTEVLFSSPNGATGLVIRGIEPHKADEALTVLQQLKEGTLDDLIRPKGAQGIIIGEELASRFGLKVGSRINLMSPSGERTTAGFVPKIAAYRVAGIFKSGLNDYDNRLAFISLQSARELIGTPAGRVSGIEVFLHNPMLAKEVSARLQDTLPDYLYTRSWIETNAGLFAALQLERIGMFIVLALIVLVGSFSIITSLVMLVMEKTKDIAILMSMGASSSSIRRIFMLQGTIIGFIGTMIGYIGGLTLAFLLQKYQFIELPHGVYASDHLPVLISFMDTALIGCASMFMCFLATIYPARQAAKLVPAEALRYE